MNCIERQVSNLRAIACAIDALASPWWEAWIQYLLLPLLTVLVPVLIALFVAHHSAKVTQVSVERQIEASRKTTLEAVEMQINADRIERRADRRRDLLQRLIVDAERQIYAVRGSWQSEVVRVDESVGALNIDLDRSEVVTLRPVLERLGSTLMAIRTKSLQADGTGDVLLTAWTLMARMIVEALTPGKSRGEIDNAVKLVLNLSATMQGGLGPKLPNGGSV